MDDPRASARRLAPALFLTLLAACGSSSRSAGSPAGTTPSTATTAISKSTTRTAAATPSTSGAPTTVAASTTSTTLAPAATEFRASVSPVRASDLPATYRPGCPIGPAQLRMLRLTFWGFDARPHEGTIVVAASVAAKVVSVFRALYAERFPIRRMQPVDAYGGRDPASMAADNTSGFNCRNAVASGPPRWSAHAYGTAIDVNTVENPYVEGGVVQPPNGAPFTNRTNVRPGMAEPGGQLNTAFAAVGWQWGGRWSGAPDYQHFSADGG